MKTNTKTPRPNYIRWREVVHTHRDESGNITAYLCREGDSYVMRSGWLKSIEPFGVWFATTDEHILAGEFTNEQRLAAHWDGFVANCN